MCSSFEGGLCSASPIVQILIASEEPSATPTLHPHTSLCQDCGPAGLELEAGEILPQNWESERVVVLATAFETCNVSSQKQ